MYELTAQWSSDEETKHFLLNFYTQLRLRNNRRKIHNNVDTFGGWKIPMWVKNQFWVNEMLKVFKRFVRSCDSFFYCKELIKTFLYIQGLNLVNVFCPQHGLLMAFAIPTLNKVPVATTPSPTKHPLSAFSSCLGGTYLKLLGTCCHSIGLDHSNKYRDIS